MIEMDKVRNWIQYADAGLDTCAGAAARNQLHFMGGEGEAL